MKKKSCMYHEFGKCRRGYKCQYAHLPVHHKLEILRNCDLHAGLSTV